MLAKKMTKRLAAGVRMAALALAAIGATGAAAAPGESSSPTAAKVDVAQAMKLRADFGLTTDPATVSAIDSSSSSTESDLGIPLTAAESAEMARQYTLGQYVGAISDAGQALPTFGGVRVDKGYIVVSMIADSPAAAAGLAQSLVAKVPASDPVKYETVAYSAADVAVTQDRINAEVSTQLGALGVLSTWQSFDGQSIDIALSASAPVGAEAAVSKLFPEPYIHVSRGDGETTFQ